MGWGARLNGRAARPNATLGNASPRSEPLQPRRPGTQQRRSPTDVEHRTRCSRDFRANAPTSSVGRKSRAVRFFEARVSDEPFTDELVLPLV